MSMPVPSLAEASAGIAAGTLSPVALTEAALARIALDPKLNAFITLTADRTRQAAAAAEAEIKVGKKRGPLHGIPYALKDIYDAAGIRTTAHSKLLIDNVAKEDATTTAKIEASGMVLLGKLSTHEFARGEPTVAPRVVDVDEGPFRRSHPITDPFNATGHPVLALPCGFAASGLPLGLHLIGRRYAEAMLLRIAQGYEQAAGWVKRRPALPA
jgi:Asp-tRNA(Asn)/Glu-tRNA(Gln) amidotransferase A subunit family amidase